MNEIKLQVGVKIFLRNNEGKFLLLKRNTEKYLNIKGEWDIVGGRIDAGSKLIDNLRREVMEETKLEITSDPKLIFAQDIIPNEEKHIVRLTYIGNTFGVPVLDTSENVLHKWVTLEELKEFENLDIYAKEIVDLGLIN